MRRPATARESLQRVQERELSELARAWVIGSNALIALELPDFSAALDEFEATEKALHPYASNEY